MKDFIANELCVSNSVEVDQVARQCFDYLSISSFLNVWATQPLLCSDFVVPTKDPQMGKIFSNINHMLNLEASRENNSKLLILKHNQQIPPSFPEKKKNSFICMKAHSL